MNTKYTASAIIATIFIIGIFFRIQTLGEQIQSPSTFKQEEKEAGLVPEDRALFEELWQNELITADEKDRLNLEPSDFILAEKAKEAQKSGSSDHTQEELKKKAVILKKLYASKPGEIIQNQVRLWNGTRFLAAIRDNRPQQSPRNRANDWRHGDPQDTEWNFMHTGDLVPESYGYVNNGKLRPHFNDWRAVYADCQTITFNTTVNVDHPVKLTVHVIGKPVLFKPKPKSIMYLNSKGPVSKNTRDKATACELIYDLKKEKNQIAIQVTPIKGKDTAIEGLCIRKKDKSPQPFTWMNLHRRAQTVYHRFKIVTSDDVNLTNEDGEPTSETEKLGLLPLVGMGRKTPYALYDVLSRSGLPAGTSTIKLTIDSTIQEVTRDVLLKKLNSYWMKKDNYKKYRRAAVVILDVKSGAIRAAVTYPTPPQGVNPWDLASFRKIYPKHDPMLMRAWQGLDNHNAPGSTFKTVTALSALKYSSSNQTIAGYIDGYTKSSFAQKTGLSLNCRFYDPYKEKCYVTKPEIPVLNNSHGAAMNQCYAKAKTQRLGLSAAIQESINLWFARLAQMMDGDKAIEFENIHKVDLKKENPLPDFHLARMARKLGFGEPINLVHNLPPDIELFPCRPIEFETDNKKWSTLGGIIYGQESFLNIMKREHADRLLWVLTQNSFGQGVTASPLQMAKVAASICKARVIHPYLLSSIGGRDYNSSLKSEPLDIDEKKMQKLRAGMKKAVTEGTAAGCILHNTDKFRVKTGTAEVDEAKNFNTAWLIGWYDDKYAFACMITHAFKNKRFGGTACGPIMNDIMAEIDKLSTRIEFRKD